MGQRIVSVVGGLVLALGMGVLLLEWLDRGEGAGITGLLFTFGVAAGVAVVVLGVVWPRESE